MKTIKGFFHVAMMCNWLPLMNKQLTKLTNSGLLQQSQSVYLYAVGSNNEFNKIKNLDKKIIPIHISDNLLDYEHPTINKLHQLSKKEDFACYYFHTKGVSIDSYKANNEKFKERFQKKHVLIKYGKFTFDQVKTNTIRWRLFLEYFMIEKWKKAFFSLNEYDCVGADWITGGFPHFSGNFWWANSKYLSNLQSVYTFPFTKKDYRIRAEAWVGQNPNVRAKELSNLKMHYYQSLPPKDYQL